MDIEAKHSDSNNEDFRKLIKLLDEDLYERYGDLQKEYRTHNKVDDIIGTVVIYKDGISAACGAIKEYDEETAEIKRVYVSKECRRRGLSKRVLNELENAARNKGYKYAVLETGTKQFEAIGLYKKFGYQVIQNYGPYEGMPNSVCMKKCII